MIQIRNNLGGITTLADVWNVPSSLLQTNNEVATGLASGSEPATWFKFSDYYNPSWEADISSSEPMGHLYFLKQRNTASNHAYYLNHVLNNGAFVWGNAYDGGLYLYRPTSSTYGFALFMGYGVDELDSNYEIFKINDGNTLRGTSLEQVEYFTIVRNAELNNNYEWEYPTSPYRLVFGGDYTNSSGVSCTHYGVATADQYIDNQYHYVDYLTDVEIYEAWSAPTDYYVYSTLTQHTYMIPRTIYYRYFPDDRPTATTYYTGLYFSSNFSEPTELELEGYVSSGSWIGGNSNIIREDPNSGASNSSGGGYGTPSKVSDDIGLPSDSQFSNDAITAGCITVFNPTETEMKNFNRWLFASFTDSVWSVLQKVISDPLDLIINVGMIRHTPTATNMDIIKFQTMSSGVSAYKVDKEVEKIEMGSIEIKEQFCTYLDYSGYSDAKIYLPFIGIRSLDINDIMNAEIGLYYYIDNITGACEAHIKIERSDRYEELGSNDDSSIDSVLYKFTGNAMQEIPITAKNYKETISALTSIATATGASVATGSVGIVGTAVAQNASHLKPSIERSGHLGSNYGIMDCLTPYVILERPIRAKIAEFGEYMGYPASATYTLNNILLQLKNDSSYSENSLTFVKARQIVVDNIHLTENEKNELKDLVTSGIYFRKE